MSGLWYGVHSLHLPIPSVHHLRQHNATTTPNAIANPTRISPPLPSQPLVLAAHHPSSLPTVHRLFGSAPGLLATASPAGLLPHSPFWLSPLLKACGGLSGTTEETFDRLGRWVLSPTAVCVGVVAVSEGRAPLSAIAMAFVHVGAEACSAGSDC